MPVCSGLVKPDTHLGENARDRKVADDQAATYLYPPQFKREAASVVLDQGYSRIEAA